MYISHTSFSYKGDGANWILDSGASHHFCRDKNLFSKYVPLSNEIMSVAVKNVSFPIEGKGEVRLRFGQRIFTLTNVMHSSQLRRNLISGPQLDLNGLSFHGGCGEVKIMRGDEFLFKAYLKDRIYRLYPKIPNPGPKSVSFESCAASKLERMKLWHRRCGHVSPSILVHTSKNQGVRGLPSLGDVDFLCEACKLGKFRSVSFKSSNKIRSDHPLELLFADVWGPCRVEGRGGERYFLSIIDDFSRRVSVYPMKLKSQVFDIVKLHITRAETYLGRKVKCFRTDNGKEFANEAFREFFDSKGIKHEFSNPYTPQQNGTVERFMQTAVNGIRTLLCDSKMNPNFWPEALKYFVYTWNRVCPKKLKKTPFELYGGRKPSIRHLKPFGTVAYVGVPGRKRSKLEAKARRGILVGYAFKTRGYRIWFPETNEIIESINVSFDEKSEPGLGRSGVAMGPEDYTLFSPVTSENQNEDVVEVDTRMSSSPSNFPHDTESSGGEDIDSGSSDTLSPSTISSLRDVSWFRKPATRRTGNRVDIYYYEQGKTQRLRSLADVQKYCKDQGIKFHADLFDFSGSNPYRGIVPIPNVSESEDSNSDSDSLSSSQLHPVA